MRLPRWPLIDKLLKFKGLVTRCSHDNSRKSTPNGPNSNDSHGMGTSVIRSSTCVPSSSFTLPVPEKTIGPGVLRDPVARLNPFNPKTPRGIPALICCGTASPPAFKSTFEMVPMLSLGAPRTTSDPLGRLNTVVIFALGNLEPVLGKFGSGKDCTVEFGTAAFGCVGAPARVGVPPIGILDWTWLWVITTGGAIGSGSSSLDLLGAGGESA